MNDQTLILQTFACSAGETAGTDRFNAHRDRLATIMASTEVVPPESYDDEDAEDFLRGLLSRNRIVRASDAMRLCHENGIKPHALKKAERKLGVRRARRGRAWLWTLSESFPMRPTSAGDLRRAW